MLTTSNIGKRTSVCSETCMCEKCQKHAIEQDLALMERLVFLSETSSVNLNNTPSLSEQKDTLPRGNWAIRSFNKIYFDDSSSDEESEKRMEEHGLYNKDMNTEDTMSASSQAYKKYNKSVPCLNATSEMIQKQTVPNSELSGPSHKLQKTGEEEEARAKVAGRIPTGKNERFSDSELCLENGDEECYKPFTILLPQTQCKTKHKITKSLADQKVRRRVSKQVFKVSREETACL